MKRLLAEFFGTFVLVFVGCGSAVFHGPAIGPLGVALTFGLTLTSLIYVLGPVSGCHINPAVTLGLWLSRRIAGREALGFVGAQVAGGIVASSLLLFIAQSTPGGYDPAVSGFAANGYGSLSFGGYSAVAAFVTEALMTALLVLAVLGATDRRAAAGFAGLAIGLTLAVTNLLAIPITGASINPARSIGPALFAGGTALNQLWLFIVAPLLGGGLGALAYRLLIPHIAEVPAGQEAREKPEEIRRKA